MEGQDRAQIAIDLIRTLVKESTSEDTKSACCYAIGVIEGVFALNCKTEEAS